MATHLPTVDDDDDYSYSEDYSSHYSYPDIYNVTCTVHRLSPHVVAILTASFAVCVALSCVGNFVVIFIMTCGEKKSKPFDSLLLNLAISDWSLGLLCLPFMFAYTMMSEWIFGEALCVIIPFAQKMTQVVSIYTVVVIGVDRCRVVLFPMRTKLTGKHIRIIISVIWIVAMLMTSPKIAYYVYEKCTGNDTQYMCNEDWPSQGVEIYIWTTFVLTYLAPFTILCLCYVMIAMKLWFRMTPGHMNQESVQGQQAANRKAVRTLVSLVILFGLCWLPLHIYNLFLITYNRHYLQTHQDATKISRASIYIWLVFSDTIFNPIVYIFMSDKFKKDCERLKKCLPGMGAYPRYSRTSTTRFNRREVGEKSTRGSNIHLRTL
ncbi:prolactin-releasing peptide receptor-like [Ptychodera flava]|uniref:prolactin-releasing peptide receptor-like n=1 Tax=Ptychodera flava TaxID=63121 RepID=UPI003969C240